MNPSERAPHAAEGSRSGTPGDARSDTEAHAGTPTPTAADADGTHGISVPTPPSALAPPTMPADAAVAPPETFRYRLKNKLLGPPLTSDRLAVERLGRPTALAVLSSDVISSSAYATEEALIPLVQVVGVAAFSLLVPITIAVIVVLVFVTLSYLEVVKVYTRAGGAYVVARENFGPRIAQVAAISLLIDYTLTVAVSVAAGVAALTSVFPSLTPETTWISIVLVLLICYANLRGVREAGRIFAVPTYFFIANMVVLLGVGAARAILGQLHAHSIYHVPGAFHIGTPGSGIFYGASLFVILRSFASGGSALTGTEAISNGVSVFRPPESRNARVTMVWMSVTLGSLVLGVSSLAAITHPVPRISGTPTVVAQIAKFVYGHSAMGNLGFVLLQAATMLILVLAANTSFTGFPYLASFAAADSFLPRQLNRRGHRLVFSNGIVALTVVSILLLIITRAQVDSLIPLYAIGVFTGFTMAGFGMVKYHLSHREPHWRRRSIINGTAGALSAVVDAIIVITKFTEGAWAIVVILPLGVLLLLRLHRQYTEEGRQLETGAVEAIEAPLLRRHVVGVLVDRLDMATARANQYARTLAPDELRAVHFDVDSKATRELERDWGRLGLSRLPLDVVECPDRRIGRAAVELVADAVADGDTECTVLLPRRGFTWGWQRLLHDRTADKIAGVVSQVPHVSATIVPFNLSARTSRRSHMALAQKLAGAGAAARRGGLPPASDQGPEPGHREVRVRERGQGEAEAKERTGRDRGRPPVPSEADRALARRATGTIPIADVEWRQRVRVAGHVKSVRVQPKAGTSNLECILVDGTGGLLLVFQGRPRIPGIEPGARLVAEGMVGAWGRRLAILNPDYELVAERDRDGDGGAAPS